MPTDFYTRMTPVQWWNYPVLALTAALEGLLLATYVAPVRPVVTHQNRALLGGVVSVFAVGCPICNKLVVLALGAGGTMSYLAPAQPVLALGALALLAEAWRRLRALRMCRVATVPAAAGAGTSPHTDVSG